MLRFELTLPTLAVEITNARELVGELTGQYERAIVGRLRRGEGAAGPLPKPKDAGSPRNPHGRPLDRTGAFVASAGSTVIEARAGGYPEGVVKAFGPRPEAEQAGIARKTAAARGRTRVIRAQAIAAATAAVAAGNAPGLERGRGGRFKAGHIRRRTVVDQASLAAILAQPPHDLRGRSGSRAVYLVFATRPEDEAAASQLADHVMRADLVITSVREVTI